MGYTMSADETAFWQDQAALLDPDAYTFVNGTSQSVTVATGERYYVINAWKCQTFGSGAGNWFHRPAHVGHAVMLPEGHVITTSASVSASFIYYCRPSLVISGDSRYTTDPRALWFERMIRLGELTRYQLGSTNTGGSTSDASFPNDFTDGLAVHTSTHDLAWLILEESGASGGMNTLNEIGDTGTRIRFAEETIFPFKRTTFPKIKVQGASQSEGAGNLTYVKLPGDW